MICVDARSANTTDSCTLCLPPSTSTFTHAPRLRPGPSSKEAFLRRGSSPLNGEGLRGCAGREGTVRGVRASLPGVYTVFQMPVETVYTVSKVPACLPACTCSLLCTESEREREGPSSERERGPNPDIHANAKSIRPLDPALKLGIACGCL